MTVPLRDAPPLVVVTGPTATGKTDVGVMVAERLGGEIISADSMLIYRYMDIGTAKPTLQERRGIPHHMIDIVDPDEEYSVALFQRQAREAIGGVLARGRVPLLVGGTGLYVHAVLDRYDFTSAGGDKYFREKLQKEAADIGPEGMHRRLAEIDPDAAKKLHPRDTRRVIRALEVYYRTGRPISSYQYKDGQANPIYRAKIFGLTMARESLYRRIEKRVDWMIAAGLVDEVHGLLERGYQPELPSMRGLGYKEIVPYLRGQLSLEEAVALLKRNTRRFAKRQLTWFRRDSRIHWLDIEKSGGSKAVALEISASLEGVL
ncbi:MAG: tRNA (adenosine(37)-N6)-dimethylallyltransferase MiaA [Firmicutes bacterium]|nr:tRNA (adenosine(37)-N6)-dimethylallyltransferase MiaA [Bacillota bacterium]